MSTGAMDRLLLLHPGKALQIFRHEFMRIDLQGVAQAVKGRDSGNSLSILKKANVRTHTADSFSKFFLSKLGLLPVDA